MLEKVKQKIHLNWVDVIIIFVVIAIVVAAILVKNKFTNDGSVQTYKMTFTADAQKMNPNTAKMFKIGDDIYNSTDGTYIGRVVNLETHPHLENDYSAAIGEYVAAEDPLTVDLWVTIEGDGYVDEKDIHIGSVIPKIGKTVYLKGKGYATVSFVVDIDTKDAPIPNNNYFGVGEREITYQVVVSDVRRLSADAFIVGERLYEKKSGGFLGVIEDVEVSPHLETELWQDSAKLCVKPDKYDIIATLRCNAVEKESGYFLDGYTELKVGSGTSDNNKEGVFISGRYIESSFHFYDILSVD